MRITTVLPALFLVLAMSSSAWVQDKGKPNPTKAEMKKFQGKWKAAEITINGASLDPNVVSKTFNIIEGKKYVISVNGNEVNGTFKLNADKEPFEIDAVYTANNNEVRIDGIYKWDNGRRIVCFGLPNVVRPSEFRKDNNYLYMEWIPVKSD